MILTCPSCATSYFVPDDAIGANGRTVRCKSCSKTWKASAGDQVLDLSAEGVTELSVAQSVTGAVLAETPAPELPKAFRAKAEQQRRLQQAAIHGVTWSAIASCFAALIGAAWLFRVEVVEVFPRAASAYAAVGARVNPMGLDFEAVSAKASPYEPGRVLITGALRNVRDKEVVAPPVRVALLDSHGAEVGHAVIHIEAAPVLPGKVQGFAAYVDDPGGRAAGVGVAFANAEQIAASRRRPAGSGGRRTPVDYVPDSAQALETAAHGAETAAAEPHGAADVHAPATPAASGLRGGGTGRPPATAAQAGLRPADAPGLTPGLGTQAPVAAVPIEH